MFGRVFRPSAYRGGRERAIALSERNFPLNKPKDAIVPAPTAASKDSGKKKKKDEKSDEEKEFESFMSEVETDLRDEAINNIWKKYSAHIIGVAVVLVAGVFGYQLYNGYVEDRREQMALTYADAADAVDSGDFDDALAKLAAIDNISGEGYSAVARLAEASVLIDQDRAAEALAIYETLASDSGADPVFRDLAVVLKVMHSMDAADPGPLEAELAPLSGPGQPFRHSALELSALLAAKQGARDRAQEYLAEILDDPSAPQSLMSRARDLSDLYASEGVPAEPAASTEDSSAAPS